MRKETGKPAVNQVVKRAEDSGYAMTYHMVLMWVELFLVFRNVMNIASSFMNAISWQRTVDQIFYVLMLLFAILSVVWHDRKKGTVTLFLYILTELIMTVMVYYFAVTGGMAIESLHEKMIAMITGLLAWIILTFVYYRKRWEYLL